MSFPSVEEEIGRTYEEKIFRDPIIEDNLSDVSEPYAQEIQAAEVDNYTYEAMLGM